MILSFDIGGTDIKHGIITQKGEIIEKGKTETPGSKTELYNLIEIIYEKYTAKYEVSAVGISIPGIVKNDGFLITAGALRFLYQCHFQKEISALLNIEIYVENDAKCATLAEKWIGYGKNYNNFLMLVIGTGIGGGVVVNDKLLRGRQNAAGEFGFMQVKDNIENDGRENSWSLNASLQTGLVKNYEERTLQKNLNGLHIYEKKCEGDQLAKECISVFYNNIALGLLNLIIAFDPEAVLLGGAISRNKEFIIGVNKAVQNLLDNHPDMINYTLPPIIPSKYRNDSGILGAAYNTFKTISSTDNQ